MFSIRIDTDNAAFSANPAEEIARILGVIAEQVENGYQQGLAFDYNGNRVGQWSGVPEPEDEE
jgi:hypothetical protein